MDIVWHLHHNYEKLAGRLPDQIAGTLDLAAPVYRGEWKGPMNGQLHRQELVRNIAAEAISGLVIETGTYRADTTRFLAETFGCPVWTVEANRRFFTYSRRRLRRQQGDRRVRRLARMLRCHLKFETGGKRGCCVLSSTGRDLALPTLAYAQTL